MNVGVFTIGNSCHSSLIYEVCGSIDFVHMDVGPLTMCTHPSLNYVHSSIVNLRMWVYLLCSLIHEVCGSIDYVHSTMNNHGCGSIFFFKNDKAKKDIL